MKPFNLEHAKAGAPVRLADGTEKVRILATDLRGTEWPIVAAVCGATAEHVRRYRIDGTCDDSPNLVMAPIATVEGREVHVGDVLVGAGGVTFEVQPWDNADDLVGATWPHEYPVTRMLPSELAIHHNHEHSFLQMFESVANAAIKHGIDNGYLCEPPKVPTDDELISAYYHPAPPTPMMPESRPGFAANLRKVWNLGRSK